MKFLFCGYDFGFDTLIALINNQHTPLAILTFPCDEIFSSNARLSHFAQENDIPLVTEKPTRATLEHFAKDGAEIILSTGYLYKIPDCSDVIPYAVNIHPSLLPKARGLMPLPHIIQQEPGAAGLSAHKISSDYDAGDLIHQHPITLSGQDTLEQLSARLGMVMPSFTLHIIDHLATLWDNAQPQDHDQATTCHMPSDARRVIDWTQDVDAITRQARAFGRMGVLFELDNGVWVTNSLSGWQEEHSLPAGELIYLSARDIVFTCDNGFICISDADRLSVPNTEAAEPSD